MRIRKHAAIFALVAIALAGVASAYNKANAPACPKGANNDQSRQPTDNENATLQAAINALKAMAVPGSSLDTLAKCLDDKLKACEICVSGFNAKASFTFPNGRAGWSGDPMAIHWQVVRQAVNNPPPTPGAVNSALCELMATLVHEGTHATNSDPMPTNRKQAKDYEKKALDASKAIRAAWGQTAANSATYKFLCDWLTELCALADANPTSTEKIYDCPRTGFVYNATTPTRTPEPALFGAVDSVQYTIYVMTSRTDGSDHTVSTGVRHVTGLCVYRDAPSVGQDTLWVVGQNASHQVTQCQKMVFDAYGDLVSTGSLDTIPHCKLVCPTNIDGSTKTYVLDVDSHAVRVYADTNGDKVPDTWATDYATATTFPFLNDMRTLHVAPNGEVVVSLWDLNGDLGHIDLETYHLIDTNADGVADTYNVGKYKDRYELGPHFGTYPVPGSVSVIAFGTPNHNMQLWTCTSTGTPLSQLGSTTTSSSSCEGTISFSPALTAGQYVMLKDVTAERETAPFEVKAD